MVILTMIPPTGRRIIQLKSEVLHRQCFIGNLLGFIVHLINSDWQCIVVETFYIVCGFQYQYLICSSSVMTYTMKLNAHIYDISVTP